jgi:type V secretory pathway adhesin AidA
VTAALIFKKHLKEFFMKSIVTLALALAFSGAASAATLSSTNGSVMVNQGKQFVSAQKGQALAAGDRVMVMQDGSAVVRFDDGCDVTIDGGSVAVLPAVSTCAGGKMEVSRLAGDASSTVAAANSAGTWALIGGAALAVGLMIDGGDVSP